MFSGENSVPPLNDPNMMQPPAVPVLSMTDKATKMELEALLRQPAHTSEEKYSLVHMFCLFAQVDTVDKLMALIILYRFQVLEARDKLIRLTTARNVDIKKAASAKGVCPDMCPEKERLSRESKHRVAFFELVKGTKSVMNHTIAVKEYSRSSADQDTPLAHELRPEPVLKLTMVRKFSN